VTKIYGIQAEYRYAIYRCILLPLNRYSQEFFTQIFPPAEIFIVRMSLGPRSISVPAGTVLSLSD
jgi:hypothetical protein